jgi:hypothetical protein
LISEVYNKNSHFNGFSKTGRHVCNGPIPYNEQNFDLDKSRQTFHHSLKEHHKISNIPKFRCEMFVLRAGNWYLFSDLYFLSWLNLYIPIELDVRQIRRDPHTTVTKMVIRGCSQTGTVVSTNTMAFLM